MLAIRHVLIVLVPLGLLAAGPRPEDGVVNDKQFHARLLKIAEIYTVYGRVDDEARWAPYLCRLPASAQPQFSNSADESTHGRKLYSLFARDRASYIKADSAALPGQVIIKESWLPVEVKEKPKLPDRLAPKQSQRINPPADLAPIGVPKITANRDTFHPFVEKAGKWYKADQRGDLFIMMKLDPKTEGTDEGWVYGTVSVDGKTVTSAGRVASCMKCHETKATRLFGLQKKGE